MIDRGERMAGTYTRSWTESTVYRRTKAEWNWPTSDATGTDGKKRENNESN